MGTAQTSTSEPERRSWTLFFKVLLPPFALLFVSVMLALSCLTYLGLMHNLYYTRRFNPELVSYDVLWRLFGELGDAFPVSNALAMGALIVSIFLLPISLIDYFSNSNVTEKVAFARIFAAISFLPVLVILVLALIQFGFVIYGASHQDDDGVVFKPEDRVISWEKPRAIDWIMVPFLYTLLAGGRSVAIAAEAILLATIVFFVSARPRRYLLDKYYPFE
jgi:hypothetical protein